MNNNMDIQGTPPPDPSNTQAFKFHDPRQERIHRRLLLVGPGPASFYLDACRIMKGNPALDSATHLVGHLLREIESALQDVLLPPDDEATTHEGNVRSIMKHLLRKAKSALDGILLRPDRKTGGHQDNIRLVLQELGMPETSEVAKKWRRLRLHAFAHRSALGQARQMDKEFEQVWAETEAVFDAVLDRFESQYLDYHRRINEILACSPSRKAAKRLHGSVPNNLLALDHFFNNLNNTGWLSPLRSEGFFSRPPDPERNAKDGSTRLPLWPASRYLAKVAGQEPKQVLSIILDMPTTENAHIHVDVVDAAMAMPPRLAVQLVPMLKSCMKTPYPSLLPPKLGALTVHLAKGGEGCHGLDLARTLLAIQMGEHTSISGVHAAHIEEWDYREILERFMPALVESEGQSTLRLLCDLLSDAVSNSRQPGSYADYDDYSYIWRNAIEDQEPNRTDIENSLVSAVRDAALQLVNSHVESTRETIEVIESHRRLVFDRIALHVLAEVGASASTLVAKYLCDRAKFDDSSLRHEYWRLAQRHFKELDPSQKETIFGWIDTGPDLERRKSLNKATTGQEPTDEKQNRYISLWRRDRLSVLESELAGGRKAKYDDLVSKLGPGDLGFFAARVELITGDDESLLLAGKLNLMNIQELLSFLHSWKPTGGFMEPDYDNVGFMLATIVVSDPFKFATEATSFAGLRPEYAGGIIAGFRDALRTGQNQPFPWATILDLCDWVMDESSKELREMKEPSSSRNWRWTRQIIAELLRGGFADTGAQIPFQLRDRSWVILQPLAEDPDPSPQSEAGYSGPGIYGLAINTVRGQAMHAVIHYALWVARNLKSDNPLNVVDLGKMPEVTEVLDGRLSKIPAGRVDGAVCGRFFPWLVSLDTKWAKENVARIFPSGEKKADLREAAWTTYVTMCQVHDNVFEVLAEEYARTVAQMDTSLQAQRRPIEDPDNALAKHLMALYWRGVLRVEAGGIIADFFSRARAEVRGHAISYVGRSLKSTNGVVNETILERLTILWNQRLEKAKEDVPGNCVQELSAFGWWFVSEKFDDSWAIAQLTEALRIVGQVDVDHIVMERLAALSPSLPSEVVQVLRLMVEGDREGWHVRLWRKQLRVAIAAVMKVDEKDARAEAVALVNRLAARGHLDFSDLLPSS